jgi:hypothetical protein
MTRYAITDFVCQISLGVEKNLSALIFRSSDRDSHDANRQNWQANDELA